MITGGQRQAVSGSASPVCVMPPGDCQLQLANAGTASPVYIGIAGPGSLTTLNGFPLPSGLVPPMVLQGYPGGLGGSVTAITGSGTASVAWLLSTATGQTGF